jgi:hypothetical protein
MNEGDSGDEIALVLERMAPEVYKQLSGHTVEQLTQYFAVQPAFRPIFNHPRLKEVLEGFVEYDRSNGVIDVAATKPPA